MTKWLYKILLIVISLSFFTAAIELNIGECHQTFFDEYDTYVKAEQVSLDHATTQRQERDSFALIYYIISHYRALKGQAEKVKHPHLAYYNISPPKRFLLNSVWRI